MVSLMNTNMTDTCTINEAILEMEGIVIKCTQAIFHLRALEAHGVQIVDKLTLEPVVPDNVVLMPERRH